jgi:hypothetical protein
MVGKNGRHHKKMPTEGVRAVTSHGRRFENHSRQHRSHTEFETHNTENALTTAHFPCGKKLTALPSEIKPQIKKNLTKAFKKTQNWQTTFKKTLKNTSYS